MCLSVLILQCEWIVTKGLAGAEAAAVLLGGVLLPPPPARSWTCKLVVVEDPCGSIASSVPLNVVDRSQIHFMVAVPRDTSSW